MVSNSKTLAAALMKRGYKLVTDGTDNHCILWDLRPIKLTGSKMEKICDVVKYFVFCFLTIFLVLRLIRIQFMGIRLLYNLVVFGLVFFFLFNK